MVSEKTIPIQHWFVWPPSKQILCKKGLLTWSSEVYDPFDSDFKIQVGMTMDKFPAGLCTSHLWY